MPTAPKRLLLSIHDVTPAHARRIDRLAGLFADQGCAERYAILVVPNFHGDWPLQRFPEFQRRLRAWADQGIEVLLHGLRHLDDSRHASISARFRAEVMTAGEGEFLGLDQAEATWRLREGRSLLQDIIGRDVDGFVAPAWLYGLGAMAALAEEGFPLAEDHMTVWRPADAKVLSRGPVVTYATRSRLRLLSSLMVSRAATALFGGLKDLRLAVHPGDADSPEVLGELRRALPLLAAGRSFARYADLADG